MAKKQSSAGTGGAVLAGAGIAALAVAAYFFTGERGVKNKKHLKGWAVRMKGEVLEKLEDVQDVTEPVYRNIVDTVAKAQAVSNSISKKEIAELAEELKRDWRGIVKFAKGSKPKSKSRAKTSSTKSTSKKTVNKKTSTKKVGKK